MKRKLATLATGALMMIGMAGTVAAAPPPFTTVCLNPAGNEVQGERCQGEALDEVNLNPAGKAPPGQN
jgi:hypothetical protein